MCGRPDQSLTTAVPVSDFDIQLHLLLEGVFLKYQHDFRNYSRSSLRRRVQQAMDHFGCTTVSGLQDKVLNDAELFSRMLQFFTVQHSEMFRDPQHFRLLAEEVLPMLATYPSIKIWVAGCSNGEEVWSLAILLHEQNLLERSVIYATDINAQALRTAESGIYASNRIAQFSTSYLEAGGRRSLSDYYHAAYDKAVFDRSMRRHMVFADHSLATDNVFSEVHLVSCRNVLIYFDRRLQDRALRLFRESLVPRGYLSLGSKESLAFSAHVDAFAPLHTEQRIYQLRA